MCDIQDFYEIKTPASGDPVSFADFVVFGRDIDSNEQTLVESLISSATELIESVTNRVYSERVYVGYFDGASSSKYESHSFIQIRRAPLISVDSVTINSEIVSPTDYLVKQKDGFSRILFLENYVFDNVAYPIEIEFTTGYSPIPENIKTAIKQTVLFWYENRGDVSTDGELSLPRIVMSILRQYRIVNTFG